jgi:hypothetical protein
MCSAVHGHACNSSTIAGRRDAGACTCDDGSPTGESWPLLWRVWVKSSRRRSMPPDGRALHVHMKSHEDRKGCCEILLTVQNTQFIMPSMHKLAHTESSV